MTPLTVTEVVTVTGVAAGGDGIARLADGRVVFCEGGLPGEQVAIRVTDRRKDYARAVVVEIIEASSGRREAPCPHVGRGCGGCTWQHVLPEHQLELKARIVGDALRRIARRPDIVVRTGKRVAEEGYRTSLRLAVDATGRPSYRRRHTNDPLGVDSCLVAHPALADLVAHARFPGAGEVGLRVGAATGERMAWTDREQARAQVPEGTLLGQEAAVHELVAGRRWRVSGGAFFQSGPRAAEILVASVLAAWRGSESDRGSARTVVDLYAGGGLLGGSIAGAGDVGRLIAVESNLAAVGDARVNLADLDAEIVHRDVAGYRGGPADLVVADPARSGLGPSAAEAVAAIGAPTLVLVSCDPASLARDTRILAARGYDLEAVEVVDLFPDTFHTETVSRFRAAGDPGAGR